MNKKGNLKSWLFAAMVLLASAGMAVAEGTEGTTAPAPEAAAVITQPAPAPQAASAVPSTITLAIDKTELKNGGKIMVTGKAPAGQPVFLEVWAEGHDVRSSRFDSEMDKDTGKRPYIFYITNEMPAYYKIFTPKTMKGILDKEKENKGKWSYSALIKALNADKVYSVPAKAKIDHFQSSLMASIVGSRGDQLPALSDKDNRKRSMQLVKARFRSIDKVFGAAVDVQPDGTFTAEINIREGLAPGEYKIRAVTGSDVSSAPATFTNSISFPTVYMANAGTSINLIYPFLLTLVVSIFGVLMGAGGGFIMNPLLVTLFPALPHTIVAGTVTPTVLFSQGSGIYNYSKIKFISWKLGVGIGLAMLAGGFIGPKLTEMITLDQFKSAFGWILLVLAALMFRQTTPGYLASNKKEQAIMKEFKKRAEEAAKK